MSLTNFPNGILTPLIVSPGHMQSTGKVFFVNGGDVAVPLGVVGADGGPGTYERPFATIQAAIDRCISGRGDVIYVLPGSYVENVVVDEIDYLQIIGVMVSGYARPDIVPTSGKALTVSSSQGFAAKHFRMAAPAADTDLVLQEGNGFIYYDCVFDGDSTQGNAKGLLRLKGNADDDSFTASEGIIKGNLFRGSGGVGIIFDTGAAPGNGVGCTDDIIEENRFYLNDQADIVTQDSGTGTYSVQTTLIRANHFMTKNKSVYIDFTTANGGAASDQTGAINDNIFATDSLTTTNVAMVGTGFTFTGNLDTVGIQDGSGFD